MANRLDKMDYAEYLEYLNERDVLFSETEGTDIDYWFTVYVEVQPASNKLKSRFFDNNGGGQLFIK